MTSPNVARIMRIGMSQVLQKTEKFGDINNAIAYSPSAGSVVTAMMKADGMQSFPKMYSSLPIGREKYNRNARDLKSREISVGATVQPETK